MKNLWLVPIEPIETRYTKHWYEYLQGQIENNCPGFRVFSIEGELPAKSSNTPGAFFNFADTMAYKSDQAKTIAECFSDGMVKDGDVFLFTDYWNPTAHNVRYMADLLDINVKIVGICHAGAWDPADLLGQKFKNKEWSRSVEWSFEDLYDHKIFATKFSKSLYESSFGANPKNHVTGFPMEYYDEILTPYWDIPDAPVKQNVVVFPHRKSPEKNLGLFLALKEACPEYEFVVAMDVCKTKDDYHNLLYRSKLAFSASLQETLGISMGIEALRCGCDVLVPDRLSYREMAFAGPSRYPANVADTYDAETNPKTVEFLAMMIRYKMNSYDMTVVRKQHDDNYEQFFKGTRFYQLLNSI
jgi:hypothetical protein